MIEVNRTGRVDAEFMAREISATLAGVESVVLSGSRAREEQIPDELVEYRSDYDLVVVCPPASVLSNLRRVSELECTLSEMAAASVTIGLLPDFLIRRCPLTTYFYELKTSG